MARWVPMQPQKMEERATLNLMGSQFWTLVSAQLPVSHPLVKHSLKTIISALNEKDQLAIVEFNTNSRVAFALDRV